MSKINAKLAKDTTFKVKLKDKKALFGETKEFKKDSEIELKLAEEYKNDSLDVENDGEVKLTNIAIKGKYEDGTDIDLAGKEITVKFVKG